MRHAIRDWLLNDAPKALCRRLLLSDIEAAKQATRMHEGLAIKWRALLAYRQDRLKKFDRGETVPPRE